MVSFIERLERAKAEAAKYAADPLAHAVEATVRGQDAIGTAPLLDLLGLPKTTGNGRRLAPIMRALGFVPVKSRRLLPGGYRDTVTRGWARPLRSTCNLKNTPPGNRVVLAGLRRRDTTVLRDGGV